MPQDSSAIRRGVYNTEYFSGAQVSLYIGNVWVDEVTTLSYELQQDRRPIYGYASTLFDGLSEGNLIIQGSFTVNFKEAGYLWLILDEYRKKMKGGRSLMDERGPFRDSASVNRYTVERLVNNETDVVTRNKLLRDLAQEIADNPDEEYRSTLKKGVQDAYSLTRQEASTSLGGYASATRSTGGIGKAENLYELFEDAVWRKKPDERFTRDRRADDPDLNPFDIYVAYGDFAGNGTVNHTIEKIEQVTIIGKSKQIVIDGMPIQEQYSFIGRNIV